MSIRETDLWECPQKSLIGDAESLLNSKITIGDKTITYPILTPDEVFIGNFP